MVANNRSIVQLDENCDEPRHAVRDHDEVRLRIQREGDSVTEPIDGTLFDLSPSGLKFRIGQCLQIAEVVSLTVVIEPLHLEITVSGQVCWTRPDDRQDQWQVGCWFSPSLGPEVFSQLAGLGLINRRQHERMPANVRLQAFREMDLQAISAEVVDYSKGGFCLATSSPCHANHKIRLMVPQKEGADDLIATGKVRWEIQVDNRYIVGCTYTNAGHFGALHDYVCRQDRGNFRGDDQNSFNPPETNNMHRAWPNFAIPVVGSIAAILGMILVSGIFGTENRATQQHAVMATPAEKPLLATQAYQRLLEPEPVRTTRAP